VVIPQNVKKSQNHCTLIYSTPTVYSWWYVVPKDTFKFYRDGALKMYCLVAHFRLYIDVTLNKANWECCPFTRKVSEEKILLRKEDRVMQLIRLHIEM
jgi:hypothetical protein